MATIQASGLVDPESDPGDLKELENSLEEAITATRRSAEPTRAEAPAEEQTKNAQNAGQVERPDWIPEKFWVDGDIEASAAKMAAGYKNLESAHGRMANDLGTQRKITDQLLALDKRSADLGHEQPAATERPHGVRPALTIDPTALVENPTETLNAFFETREAALRQQYDEEYRRKSQEAEAQAFLAKHPDYTDIAQSDEFVEWVGSSPLRARAADLARAGDFVIADELLTEYGALQGSAPAPSVRDDEGNPVVDDEEAANLEAARQASTESAAQAGGSTDSKKTYRRTDLIRLKVEKPEVYSDPEFQKEILRAYAEKRVR